MKPDLSYILNELGEDRQRHYGSVTPPVYQSSNFCFSSVEEMRAALSSEMDTPFYTRGNNPTVSILRKKVAALEGMEEALIFGSGSAAIAAAVINTLQSGDHAVCVKKPYSWTEKLLDVLLKRYGVSCTFIEGKDPSEWERACRENTRLFMLESPNSFTFELQDISAVSEIARKRGITTVLDNSYASPLNQNPKEYGIDIVVHSASKYLAGHSDIVAGVLCTDRNRAENIFENEFMTLGGIISPHDAWLMIRGLRTLAVRMNRVAQTTPEIVSFLHDHPKVRQVLYPHHPSHEQFELAKRQQKNPSGQFSLILKTDEIQKVEHFCNSLQRFLLACSWGGYESLVFPACASSKSGLPVNIIRFYTGLEEPEVLIGDLRQALDKI